MSNVRYIDTAEVAKLIRKDLKAVFGKSVKFSVRSSRYSGGSSIRVSWNDGPTEKMVEAIAKGYAGSGFDGMTDFKYSFESYLDGERVRFCVDFVFCDRQFSDERKAQVAKRLGFDVSNGIESLSIDEMQEVLQEASKRCDSRIYEQYVKNFEGPRAMADVEQAEERRSSVYPRQERESGFNGANAAEDVERYSNAEDAVCAARQGKVINVMDLINKN